MRMLIIAVALTGLIGCTSSRVRPAYDPNAVTLCVQNSSIGYGNIVVYAGTTRFTVYPSEEVCRDVRATGPGLSVRAGSTGGTSTGPLRFAFQLPLSADCWHWRIGNSPVLDIVECQ